MTDITEFPPAQDFAVQNSRINTVHAGINYALPPKPERRPLEMPRTIKDYAQIIAYYESLVQEWELWGKTVEKTVTGEQAQDDKKH